MKKLILANVPNDATDIFINNIGCLRYSHNKGRESSVVEPNKTGVYLENSKHEIVGETFIEGQRHIVIDEIPWIEYGNPFPPLGIEVIAFKPEWIDEDFNPRGIRIGFQNEMESEEGTFVSAEWLDYHDSYMTRDGEKDKPTLWMPLPAAPEKGGVE